MQKLYFDPKWDQTIAQIDREKIRKEFQSIETQANVHLSFLWAAVNHKRERLITVLIHNPGNESLRFNQVAIGLQEASTLVETALFTVPLDIPSQTSMPWTFIFSDGNKTTTLPDYVIYNP